VISTSKPYLIVVCRLFPMNNFSSASGIVLKTPCFMSSDNFSQKVVCHLTKISKHTSPRYHSFFFLRDLQTHTSYQTHNFHTTGANAFKPQLVHVYCGQDAWLPLSHKVRPLRERHSHSLIQVFGYMQFISYPTAFWLLKRPALAILHDTYDSLTKLT
jgi:hypothetical protein